MKNLVKAFVENEAHLNEADFIRDAIREKIMRDDPDLFGHLLRKTKRGEASVE